MTLLPACHLQTPAEAQAEARGAVGPAPNPAANQNGPGPGGFKVGDTVRVLFDGWQEAKVLQVRGSSYMVRLPNGVEVSELWPMEVRRLGKLTAEDHAMGQYDLHDRVQVLVNGRWMEGEIRGQNLNMYDIKAPGVDTGFGSDIVNTTPENIRMSATTARAMEVRLSITVRSRSSRPLRAAATIMAHSPLTWQAAIGRSKRWRACRIGLRYHMAGLSVNKPPAEALDRKAFGRAKPGPFQIAHIVVHDDGCRSANTRSAMRPFSRTTLRGINEAVT